MAPRTAKPVAPPDPTALKRATAGRYVTGDERFTVEQGSNGWMILDAEHTDDFGLPLVRGPFATLDAAKAALADARSGPAPSSGLATRPPPAKRGGQAAKASKGSAKGQAAAPPKTSRPKPPPEPPPIKVRTYRPGEGDELRALWESVGFTTTWDDDASLRAFATRNPGMFLVATRGDDIIATALGAWDGRRGWIYHVAVAEGERRGGLATDLVHRLEDGLRKVGARRVNVHIAPGNKAGAAFWRAMGYERRDIEQHTRELDRR